MFDLVPRDTRHRVIDPDSRSTGGRFVDSQHRADAEARAARRRAINASRLLLEALRDEHGESGRPDLARARFG